MSQQPGGGAQSHVNFIHGRNGSEYFPFSGNGKQCCMYSWPVNSTLKLLIAVGANLVNSENH